MNIDQFTTDKRHIDNNHYRLTVTEARRLAQSVGHELPGPGRELCVSDIPKAFVTRTTTWGQQTWCLRVYRGWNDDSCVDWNVNQKITGTRIRETESAYFVEPKLDETSTKKGKTR